MNPNGLIDQILSGLGGGAPGGSDGRKDGAGSGLSFPGGVGGAAAAAGIAGLLLGSKKGRKTIGKAAKYGGVAVLGGLAYRAWQQHQAGQSGPDLPPSPASDAFAPPEDERFLPDAAGQADLSMALLQAMIGAAKADGHIDSNEQAQIFDAIRSGDLEADDKAFLFEELNKPLDPDAIGALATSPEMAAELYVASVVVIGEPEREERRYLDRLAGRLNLDPALQDTIEREVTALPSA